MAPLFSVQTSNEHAALIAADTPTWKAALQNLNRSIQSATWPGMRFELHVERGRRRKPMPDIAKASASTLAFRAPLRDLLFPSHVGLEFLPVKVDDEDWILLSCLNTVSEIDEQRSLVHRSIYGQIIAATTLFLPAGASAPEIFTIADSNRAQLFVTSAFKTRVDGAGLRGIGFEATDSIPNYRQQAGL